jgi:hypothetical protein
VGTTPGNTPGQNTTVAPTVANFLVDYPRFDTSAVTDPGAVQFGPDALAYWLNMATLMLNQQYLSTLYYMACELFMAHNLALEAYAEQGGDATIPGIAKGMIAASASGDVSVSYNNAAVMELDAGHWNFTTFGLRFIKLIRMTCVGPLQVTGGSCGIGPYNGPAWPGPWVFNIPNPSE